MPATQIGEAYLSRSRSGMTLDLVYLYEGTDDEAEVRTQVLADAPSTHGGLSRQTNDIDIDPVHVADGGGVWVARVPYSTNEWGFNTGAESYFFDTSGGIQRITHSKEVVNSYAASGTPPNIGGAAGGPIGREGEGIDIPVAQFEWEETHIFSWGDINAAYKRRVKELTGRVNNAAFGDQDEGEVLFLGARGGRLPDNTAAITFKFAASENTASGEGIDVGDMTDIQKEGWEYLDVWFEDAPIGDPGPNQIMAKKPKFAFVHRVFDKDDFSDLGI